MAIEFKKLARVLSCREFAEAEMELGKNGRARCPFHGGHNYNLAFYDRDGKCHCHKCGRTADVVQLASAVWAIPQIEAADELNRMFSLGLDHQTATPEDRQRWQRRVDQRDAQRQAAEDAVTEAEAEAERARAAAEAAGPDSPEHDELHRQAKNAADWLAFKKLELSMLAAARG